MKLGMLGWAFVFWIFSGIVSADDASVSLIISKDITTALQLEARQAPLAQVLDKITQTTGVSIHYSVLPEGRVTATCVGATLRQILECVLNHKADLIFRYPHKTVWHTPNNALEEVWVLGAKFDAISPAVSSADCEATLLQQQNQLQAMRNQKPTDASSLDQTDAMLKLAQSKDPAERSQGIGGLLAEGKPGDPTIKATLEAALSDSNADVRAQAISSFAHRNEEGTESALQTALQDESVDVRVMAVDSARNNTALLQQALHDKDEIVRSLAALKLESLNTENTR
ncbi:HEAT repeat domain-containing protein [Crenothrix sp.]|uniref:HEAT repeat domain-containing protein n=1 Tax=Crenothrix sp. TaxID=3100433 RepID=UPI00374D8677